MREDRIDERVLRAHAGVTEAELPIPVGVRQHARAGHLAPCPGRRRAEDETDPRWCGHPVAARVVGHPAALVGGDPGSLRDVEGRAAADPDYRVEAAVPSPRGELVRERERRLT